MQPSLVTIIAIDILVNLLDMEIASYLTTPDSSKAEEDKPAAEADTKSDSVDSSADAPGDGKTSEDAKSGQDQPALPDKPVQLADREKQVVDTVSVLCSKLLPRLISYAHTFLLNNLSEGSDSDASLADVYDVLLSIAGFKSSMFGISGNITLFSNYLPDVLKEVLKSWSSSLLLTDSKVTTDKNRKEALFSISLEGHFSAIAGYKPFDPSRSLKTAMMCLLKLSSRLQQLSPGENFSHFIAPLYTDAIGGFVSESKEKFAWGDEKALALTSSTVLVANSFRLISNPIIQDQDIFSKLLEDTITLFDRLLDCSAIWPALSLLDVNAIPTGQ